MTVVAAGEIVVDWLSTVPGETFFDARSFYRALGGNATNVAVGVSRLGTKARLVGKVGDDIHGAYLRRLIDAEGVDSRFVYVDAKTPTAQCYGITDLLGEHRYYNWPRPHAAQMLSPDNVEPQLLHDASFLHASGISFTLEPRKLAIEKLIKLARRQGLIVSFDASFPTDVDESISKAVEQAFLHAQLLKFNKQELLYWADPGLTQTIEEVAQGMFEKYKPIALAVTLGGDGSLIVTRQGIVRCPAYRVDFVCGVGAGDGYVAGMIHSLQVVLGAKVDKAAVSGLSLADWQHIGAFANAVGALVTTSLGAIAGLPRPEQVRHLLESSR